MNRAPTILLIGAIQVGKLFVTAVVLMAAIEAVAFAQMALQGRNNG